MTDPDRIALAHGDTCDCPDCRAARRNPVAAHIRASNAPLHAARAHRAQGNADTEQALQDAIAEVAPSRGGGVHMRYLLPDGKTTRSLPRALGAWLDAAAPRRGRPPTRPEGARKVGLVLSPAAAAAWDAHEGDRSAWVSRLIETSGPRVVDDRARPIEQHPPVAVDDHVLVPGPGGDGRIDR